MVHGGQTMKTLEAPEGSEVGRGVKEKQVSMADKSVEVGKQGNVTGEQVVKEKQSSLVDTSTLNVENIGLNSYPPLPTQGSTPAGNSLGKSSYANVTGEPSKKANPNVNLLKEEVRNILVWVKLHGVPVTAISEDGFSVIATKLGMPHPDESKNTSSQTFAQVWQPAPSTPATHADVLRDASSSHESPFDPCTWPTIKLLSGHLSVLPRSQGPRLTAPDLANNLLKSRTYPSKRSSSFTAAAETGETDGERMNGVSDRGSGDHLDLELCPTSSVLGTLPLASSKARRLAVLYPKPNSSSSAVSSAWTAFAADPLMQPPHSMSRYPRRVSDDDDDDDDGSRKRIYTSYRMKVVIVTSPMLLWLRDHEIERATDDDEVGYKGGVVECGEVTLVFDVSKGFDSSSNYARAMIELWADVELKDTIVVAMPKLTGEGFYTYPDDHDGEDKVELVDNNMARSMALERVGSGAQSLLEQWRDSYENGDYDEGYV
uniref:Uncharacterized protein n=1 Tax=Tanacetum cinerariifolium TaxID=118510 RepID=A0A699GIP3_TANCI|nr:hypothetical protein [Tanacetum cinerariifolium]